jgi:hypothetical protein
MMVLPQSQDWLAIHEPADEKPERDADNRDRHEDADCFDP